MKKLLLLLVPVILGTMTLWGATVQVGSGTGTNIYLPIRAYYGYSYSQQIYTQAQIATLGQITKVRFYYSSGTYNNSTNWTVYLGHTSKTSFSSNTD